jgi:hypothetical protein
LKTVLYLDVACITALHRRMCHAVGNVESEAQ